MRNMLTAALLLLAAAPAPAAGLRTAFGEVVVRGLKIGQTYSLHKLVNMPLKVVNTGEEEVELLVDAIQASTDALKTGYEVVPSLDWVTVEKKQFTVGPNREAVTDLVVSIPNDPALLGRRFQADIWSRTRSARGTTAVGLQSRLLIHVDSTPPTEDELKKKFVDERLANLDFTILPMNGTVEQVPLGRPVDLRKERKLAFKIINPNEQALNFRIRSIPNWESLLNVPAGFEDAYSPKWLTPQKEVIKVAGNSILETSLVLNIPDEKVNRGKRFFFAVGIEALEQKIPVRVYYKLYATTPAEPAAAATKSDSKP